MAMDLQERPQTTARPLRAIAEELEAYVPKGYRLEILEGQVVVSPRGTTEHWRTINGTVRQLEGQLPDDLECLGELDLESPEDPNSEPIPDAFVVPREVADANLSRIDADVVEMTVEVVSRSNWQSDYEVKSRVYAGWNIPIYLILDPRDGTALLQYHPIPKERRYRVRDPYTYGAKIELPDPLNGVVIDTGQFRAYPK